jgi:spore photoproduct lyase
MLYIDLMINRLRKSNFVRLFNKTPQGVVCPHFYELILSNGCPFNCLYCYLKLTFRGEKSPVLFTNPWDQIEKELEKFESGVFSTGELADSLAIIPPLLEPATNYFRKQKDKFLLLTTKSENIDILLDMAPTPQVWVSFSVNSEKAWEKFEIKTPHPYRRLEAAKRLREAGWKVRFRIDPIIEETGIDGYKYIVERVRDLEPDAVTVGTLRQFPGLFRFEKQAPRMGLSKSPDGRMRYSLKVRADIYQRIADWLGIQPALCKETDELWGTLGWEFKACNCTIINKPTSADQNNFPEYPGSPRLASIS